MGSDFLALPLHTWSMLFLAIHGLSLHFKFEICNSIVSETVNRAHLWTLVVTLYGGLFLSVFNMQKAAWILSYVALVSSHLFDMHRDAKRPSAVIVSTASWLSALGCSLMLQGGFAQGAAHFDLVVALIYMCTLMLWVWFVFVQQEWMVDMRRETQQAEAEFQERFDMQVQIGRKEAQSEAARERAQKMAGRQAEFLATMSHELRTPLACVVGLSRMLAANEEFGATLRKDMGTVERLAVQLLRTVDDGLAFVRQEQVQGDVSSRQVQMAHLLRDIKSLATWLSKQQRNDLRFMRVRNIPSQLYFDEQKVRQILINLISNAARYCQDGEIVLGVTLRESVGRPVLEWLVEDTGRGMDEQEQRQFFEPFSKSRDSQGLGLGLALVKRLVHEVDGEINLQSEKGRGTRVRISIPVQTQGDGESQADLDDDAESRYPEERVSAPMALLPHGDLEYLNLSKLKKLVKLGQLSEIESWLAHAKSLQGLGPESHRLLTKIEAAVKVVDLPEIQALVDQVDTPLSFV